MDRPPAKYIKALDSIRGLAIIFVFVFHSLGTSFGHDQLPWGPWFRKFTVTPAFLCLLPATFGWIGVAIFFVVSGFCVHLSFLRRPDWLHFFWRRFFRIYPPYLGALLIFALGFPMSRLRFVSSYDVRQLISHIGLFHNYDERSLFGINPSFWSIAVEVQLYALYPFLVFLAGRFGWRRSLIGIAGIEITLRLIFGLAIAFGIEGLPAWLGNSPFLYWFSWSSGALIAERHFRSIPFVMPSGCIFLIGASAVASNFFKPTANLVFLLFALLTAGLLTRLLQASAGGIPLPRMVGAYFERVGLASFSIYLLHQPLLSVVPRVVSKVAPSEYFHPSLMFCLCLLSWIVIFPVARLYYRWVELPSIALGEQISPRSSTKPLLH